MANAYTDLLKMRMPDLGDVGWDDEVNDNTMISEFVLTSILKSNVVISGLAVSMASALDIDITAGEVVVAGATRSIAADSLTCTSGVKNWLLVDSTGTLQLTTSIPTGDFVAVALIDAGSTTIERICDARNFAEGALTIGVDYTPDYYAPDTGQTGAINQHLSGIDARLGIMSGFKNKIINGSFQFWQRGTSQTANGYGSADRWKLYAYDSTFSAARQIFTVGQTEVPNNPDYYLQVSVTSAENAGANFRLWHNIENVKMLSGKTITLSFSAKANAAKNLAIEWLQNFGDGGSPSISGIEVTTIALTTAWQRYELVFDIPSVIGKTIGDKSYLQLAFWFDAGSDHNDRTNSLGNQSGTFDIAEVQSEIGAIATPFGYRPEKIEKMLCNRYCQKIDGVAGGVIGAGYRRNTSTLWFLVPFLTEMLYEPAVTFSSQTGFVVYSGTGYTATTAISAAVISKQTMRILCSNSGGSVNDGALLGLNAATDYILLESEL